MSNRVHYHYFYYILLTSPCITSKAMAEAAEASMKAVIQEVQSLPHYETGEVRNLFGSYSIMPFSP